MTELSQVRWFLEHRFEQLRQEYIAEKSQPDFDPLAPSIKVKLMDLIALTLGYWAKAQESNNYLPDVPTGGQFALQIGAGVFLVMETFAGGEIPTCGFGESSYN